MKFRQRHFLLMAIILILPSFAQADDLWDDAYPYDGSPDYNMWQGNLGAGEIGFGAKAAHMGQKLTQEEIGSKSWFSAKYKELAEENIKAAMPDLRDSLLARERLADLNFSASLRELTQIELEEARALELSLAQNSGPLAEADRMIEAESKRLTGLKKIQVPDQVPVSPQEFADDASRRQRFLKGASIVGGALLIGDGAARLGLAISGRDPGYSPLITGSEKGFKLLAPEEAHAEERRLETVEPADSMPPVSLQNNP